MRWKQAVTGLALAMIFASPVAAQSQAQAPADAAPASVAPAETRSPQAAPLPPEKPVTFAEDDVLGAAEDVFGRGAEGLAELMRGTFAKYGEPNAYIVGKEIGGAVVFGLRYGSGTLYHKIEGQQVVHWTGPSIGFDVGGDGSKTFALVYNLDDSEDLFRRYPAAEGKAYLVGGFTANYLQRDRVIIVPVKLGVGARLGINIGYMKFSKKGKVVPF